MTDRAVTFCPYCGSRVILYDSRYSEYAHCTDCEVYFAAVEYTESEVKYMISKFEMLKRTMGQVQQAGKEEKE